MFTTIICIPFKFQDNLCRVRRGGFSLVYYFQVPFEFEGELELAEMTLCFV